MPYLITCSSCGLKGRSSETREVCPRCANLDIKCHELDAQGKPSRVVSQQPSAEERARIERDAYQRQKGFSVTQRSPILSLILWPFLTFGFYQIYWLFAASKECFQAYAAKNSNGQRMLTEAEKRLKTIMWLLIVSIPLMFIFIGFITLIIASIMIMIHVVKWMEVVQLMNKNYNAGTGQMLFLIGLLGIPILSLVALWMMQNAINEKATPGQF